MPYMVRSWYPSPMDCGITSLDGSVSNDDEKRTPLVNSSGTPEPQAKAKIGMPKHDSKHYQGERIPNARHLTSRLITPGSFFQKD